MEALFYSGWTLQKEGRVDDAIARFTRLLQLDPENIKASYARGACFNLKGEFTKAIDDYTVALENDVGRSRRRLESPLPSRRLRLAGRQISARSSKEVPPLQVEGETAATEPRGAGDRPSSSQENNGVAGGDDSPSAHSLSRLSKPRPADNETHLCAVTGVSAKPDAAASDKRGLENQDDEWLASPAPDAKVQKSCALGESGEAIPSRDERLWQQIEETTALLIRDPTDLTTRCQRAALFAQVGEMQEAIRDYSEALIQWPENPALYFNRGILHDECAAFDKAKRDYTSALELDPTNPDFFNNRGLTHRKLVFSRKRDLPEREMFCRVSGGRRWKTMQKRSPYSQIIFSHAQTNA